MLDFSMKYDCTLDNEMVLILSQVICRIWNTMLCWIDEHDYWKR